MVSNLNTTKEIRKIISHSKVLELHKVSEWKGILSIFLEWSLIIVCTLLSETYFSWYLYPIVVMFLGARYLALGLMNGLAIVILAIIFDRVTQKFGLRMQKYRNEGKD